MVTTNDTYCDGDCEKCTGALLDFDSRECCRSRNLVKKHETEIRDLEQMIGRLLLQMNSGEPEPAPSPPPRKSGTRIKKESAQGQEL